MHLELEEEHLYFTRESLKISMSGKDILLSATLTFNVFVSCTPPVKSIHYIKSTGRRTLRAQASLLCSNCYLLMAKHGSCSEHFEQQNKAKNPEGAHALWLFQ